MKTFNQLKKIVRNNLEKILVFLTVVSTASLFCYPSAQADEEPSLEIKWENDSFLSLLGGRFTDQHYTQGAWVRYMHHDNELFPEKSYEFLCSSSLMHSVYDFGMSIERTRGGLTVGHQFYTPENLRARRLQRNDRPYAGYFFIEPVWERRGRSSFLGLSSSVPSKDVFSFSIGIVGPAARAGVIQTKWHGLFEEGVVPRGWQHQLNNELAVNFHAERSWLLSKTFGGSDTHFDLVPTIGIDLGNVSTRLTAGVEARIGFGNIHAFSVPSMNGSQSRAGFYIFGSAEGWAVAHNIFLDGNTFSDSHSVSKENWVGEISLGIGVVTSLCDARIAWVRRSVEFELQDVPNSYLSLSATFHF